MTLDEAKKLKVGQELYYRGLEELPEKVVVSKLITDGYGKLEIHLVDNCFIPERDLDYVFLTFDECAEACKKHYEKQLEKLREMLKLETQDRSSL